MVAIFSAAGSFVHTPCGPRKSGMPESVEIPAPVSATTRVDSSIQRRTVSTSASAPPSSVATSLLSVADGGEQKVQRGLGEHPHVGLAIGLARLERDDSFDRAYHRDTRMAGGIPVAV